MIEIVTKFDASAQAALSRLGLKKAVINFCVTILSSLALGFFILFADVVGNASVPISVFFFVVAGLFALLLFMTLFLSKHPSKKNKFLTAGITNFFTFDNSYVYCKSVNGMGVETISTIPGNMLFKAAETKDHFFVYHNARTAYVIPKKDFVSGAPDELRAILQAWLPGKKYKQYGRSLKRES